MGTGIGMMRPPQKKKQQKNKKETKQTNFSFGMTAHEKNWCRLWQLRQIRKPKTREQGYQLLLGGCNWLRYFDITPIFEELHYSLLTPTLRIILQALFFKQLFKVPTIADSCHYLYILVLIALLCGLHEEMNKITRIQVKRNYDMYIMGG